MAARTALAACDVTLIASGTATLEAALFKRPMVIAYKISGLSWQIMKRMAYLPWVGLPEHLLSDSVVPERLQHDANPARLAIIIKCYVVHRSYQFESVRQSSKTTDTSPNRLDITIRHMPRRRDGGGIAQIMLPR